MTRPRPVSPLTLETCSVPLSDANEDDLLGSDDELDESARAAKRQRIERIAESHQRGNPVFILSASLRGPFEDGWKNPWKKTRKSREQVTTAREGKSEGDKVDARVIQETGLRTTKHRKYLSTTSHPSTTDVLASFEESTVTAPIQTPKDPPSLHSKANDKSILSSKPIGTKGAAPPRDASLTVEEQSFAAPGTADWLKKGGKRLNFGRFDPPSSPTPKPYLRRAENRSRLGSNTIERQDSGSPSKVQTPKPVQTFEMPHVEAARSTPRPFAPSTSRTNGEGSVNATRDLHETSPTVCNNTALSFRVASSTSQLPRFQYQRWNPQDSSPGRQSNQPTEPHIDQDPLTSAFEDPEGNKNLPIAPIKRDAALEPTLSEADQLVEPSKDLRFANQVTESTDTGTLGQISTEQNTYEHLPSAQQVPVPPGVSDRITSLHSTAVLKDNNCDPDNYDTQLSTQAALMLAQKSFQDDLESPEPDYDISPEKEDGNGDESLLAHETPFQNLATSKQIMPPSFHCWDKEKVQAISTQCMMDAATPFTFSTGKKPEPFRLLSPEATSKSPGTSARADPCFPEIHSPSAGGDYHTAPTNDGHCPAGQQQLDLAPTHRSTTQTSALPFTLSGSTPTTAHDGQGGFQRAESFNLSQAIADAGSWLQQSFDFMNEIKRPDQNTKGTSSAEAHPSAMDLDLS